MNITEYVRMAYDDICVPDVQSYYTDDMQIWKNTYENNPSWHKVSRNTLTTKSSREMNRLNVAKVLCDFFSDLTFSEQIDISISDENIKQYVENVLESNSFWETVPEILSNAYALGGFAVKVFSDNGRPCIDFIHADKFIPIKWTGRHITEGIFAQQTVKNDFYYTLIEKQSAGYSEFKLYKSKDKNNIGDLCPLSEIYNISDNIKYDADTPMFAYFKPCISNNSEYDAPLGMSIYANALDTLKAIDTAFDSLSREVVLGKKRIIVPAQSIKAVTDVDTGNRVRYFDENDEVFVALAAEDNEALKITDNTTQLRIAEHVQAINALLNILCFQVGLSAGSLSFDAVQGMKTATEVISQDSKTARTIKSNKNLLAETFETMIHAIISLGIFLDQIPKIDYELAISFKDNIIIDDNTLIDNNIKLVQAGLKSKVKAIMDVQKCDEKTAQEELERIAKEQSVTGLAVDDLLSNGEDDDENRTATD